MKVEFTLEGSLIVYAENNTERAALKAHLESSGAFGIDIDDYLVEERCSYIGSGGGSGDINKLKVSEI